MDTFSWVFLGLVGWALGLVFLFVLMRAMGDQDRAARDEQKRFLPDFDVTIKRRTTAESTVDVAAGGA